MVKMNKCWFDKLEKLHIENVKVTIKDGVVTITPYPEKDMERRYRELEEDYDKLMKYFKNNFIPISVIQNKKRELEKKKEYLKDEYDEGVVEILCRYSCAIKTLDELLEERNK